MPKIFDYITSLGIVERDDLYGTFNMGVGYIAFVAQEDVDKTLEILKACGEDVSIIGRVTKGDEGVMLCNA